MWDETVYFEGASMNAYCLILRLQRTFRRRYPSTKRCFLSANTAAQAVLIVSDDPEWSVVGIEPVEIATQATSSPQRYYA
jgi:hypothetical protein